MPSTQYNSTHSINLRESQGLSLARRLLPLPSKSHKPNVKVINEPVPGIDKVLTTLVETLETSILPLVRSMEKKLEIDLRTHDRMKDISRQLLALRPVDGGESDQEPPE